MSFPCQLQGGKSNILCHFYGIHDLLIALVTYGGPTPDNYYMHDVVTPKLAFGEEEGEGRVLGRRMVRRISLALYVSCF